MKEAQTDNAIADIERRAQYLRCSEAGRSALEALYALFSGPALDYVNMECVRKLIVYHVSGYAGSTLDAVRIADGQGPRAVTCGVPKSPLDAVVCECGTARLREEDEAAAVSLFKGRFDLESTPRETCNTYGEGA
jgi:hypothetical protein